MSTWFPKPARAGDLEMVGSAGLLSAAALFELLHLPSAQEWRSKVGVAGKADGSGKATTRLLAADGWVLKTDIARAREGGDELREELERMAALARLTKLWHPTKQWAVMRTSDGYLPLSVCRELRTLRAVTPLSARLDAWTRMLSFGVQTHIERGVGLDLNPSNFGFERPDERLYYLDDETTPRLGWAELASAIVSRLPEEPEADDSDLWRRWGAALRPILEPICGGALVELDAELRRYPLHSRFTGRRDALLEGLARPRRRRAVRSDPEFTCVLADVHGNLPALEAVLDAAQSAGVDSYIFLGDAVGYGPWPGECVARLAELPRAACVRGNHDHAIATGSIHAGMNSLARRAATWTIEQLGAAEREWLASLPLEHRAENWLAVHGAPKDPNRFLAYVYELTYEENLQHVAGMELSICFYGHTHVPFVHERSAAGAIRKLRAPSGWTLGERQVALVNPGAVGQPRDGDRRAAFALWDRRAGSIDFHRVPYRIEDTLQAIRARGLPEELASRIEEGR